MRRMTQRNAMRMMRQMGMRMDEIDGVKEVVIRLTEKELVIETPSVSVINMQGQRIYQIIGEKTSERPLEGGPKVVPTIKEEDVLLVAQQANVSYEESKKALEETSGDLAQAIILLKTR
jgi:nascent polypeptide-associated complex subunit alpha